MKRKMLPDHKTDGSMRFEEEDISAAKFTTIFQNTEICKKLIVKALHSADCTDPGYKVLNDVEIVRKCEEPTDKWAYITKLITLHQHP
jgi:hypothetical protein